MELVKVRDLPSLPFSEGCQGRPIDQEGMSSELWEPSQWTQTGGFADMVF